MTAQDLPLWAWAIPFVMLIVGHILGRWNEASYWADHGENGGSVHHRGHFYRVTKE